jgi:hypothetical protein
VDGDVAGKKGCSTGEVNRAQFHFNNHTSGKIKRKFRLCGIIARAFYGFFGEATCYRTVEKANRALVAVEMKKKNLHAQNKNISTLDNIT